MKKAIALTALFLSLFFVSCEKDDDLTPNGPGTTVPAELRGTWMYGQFSLTEYWSRNPSTYLGNGFTLAVAFRFFENGTYEQYFSSSTFVGGLPVYHQSVTKGTIEVDPEAKTIIAHPKSAHYKRTSMGITEEDRDLKKSELNGGTYKYTVGTEPNGTRAIYLKLNDSENPLTFKYLE